MPKAANKNQVYIALFNFSIPQKLKFLSTIGKELKSQLIKLQILVKGRLKAANTICS